MQHSSNPINTSHLICWAYRSPERPKLPFKLKGLQKNEDKRRQDSSCIFYPKRKFGFVVVPNK